MRRSTQRRHAVFTCYQEEVTSRPLHVLLADAQPFTRELAFGVDEHRADLDEVIAEYSRGWSLNRIAPLEKNIMRVALYEMNYRDDVPFEVAIDEAVETAKKFCGAEAPGFVNGILGSAARAMGADATALDVRTAEIEREAAAERAEAEKARLAVSEGGAGASPSAGASEGSVEN